MALFKKNRTVDTVQLHGLTLFIQRKKIKNIHLRVYGADGEVRISCPERTSLRSLGAFVEKHLDWIRVRQQALQDSALCSANDFNQDSQHYFQGYSHTLQIRESRRVFVERQAENKIILLHTPRSECAESKRLALEHWYRQSLQEQIPGLIARWEPVIKRPVREWRIKKMKTRWGTCNPQAQRIWLNLELAKTPLACLEYVLVHEMVHLLEQSHNAVFKAYMDRFLPEWRERKALLRRFVIK